jgi:TPR repeat protein
MYEKGKGVRKSSTKALKYYGKACDLELALGCKNYKSHAFWKNLSALKSSRLTSLPVTYLNPRSTHSAPVLHSFT